MCARILVCMSDLELEYGVLTSTVDKWYERARGCQFSDSDPIMHSSVFSTLKLLKQKSDSFDEFLHARINPPITIREIDPDLVRHLKARVALLEERLDHIPEPIKAYFFNLADQIKRRE